MLSIGGYLLSQTMDQAGNSAALAQIAADQIATLVQITGAVGVDLDYEPVNQTCIPANMALLCQKIQTAVKALDPTYEIHLTIIPPLSQADPDLKTDTALACDAYVDQINVMTYDDPNTLDQPPYQPENIPVFSHTGVSRSVQSIQWFLDKGVTREKLGLGIAAYGRNTANNGQAFTNNGTPYDQIVRVAGSSGVLAPEFQLGRLNAAVPIVNPNPTTEADFYYNPTTAIWGLTRWKPLLTKFRHRPTWASGPCSCGSSRTTTPTPIPFCRLATRSPTSPSSREPRRLSMLSSLPLYKTTILLS